MDLGSYQPGSWAHELSRVWAPNRTACDEMPNPPMGAPSYQPSVVGGTWGQLSLSHETEAPGTWVSGQEVPVKGRSPQRPRGLGVGGWGLRGDHCR